MPEKFNFNQLDMSKEDDQKKYDQEFDKLPKDEQMEVVGEAQEEASIQHFENKLTEFRVDEKERIENALKFKKDAKLSNEDIRVVAEKNILQDLKWFVKDRALEKIKAFGLPADFIETPEAKKAIRDGAISRLNQYISNIYHIELYLKSIDSLMKEYNIDNDIKNEIIKKHIIEKLSYGGSPDVNFVLKTLENFELPKEILESPEVQKAAEKCINICARNMTTKKGWSEDVLSLVKITEKFNLPTIEHLLERTTLEKILETQLKWEMEFIDDVHEMEKIESILSHFSISEEKIYKIVLNKIEELIDNEEYNQIRKINKYFKIPKKEITSIAEKKWLQYFNEEDYKKAKNIRDNFHLSQEIPDSSEIKKQLKQKIISQLLDNDINQAINLKDASNFNDEELSTYSKSIIIKKLYDGEINEACNMARSFDQSKSIVNSMEIKDILEIRYPQNISFDDLAEIREINQIGEKLLQSIYNINIFSFPNHIKPIISAQSDAAYLYFELIKEIANYENLTAEDIEYISLVGKKYGTQARNILENILLKIGVGKIGKEKEIIEEYLSKIGIVHFDIYSQYKKAKIENNTEEVGKMKERISNIQDGIYEGVMEEKYFDDSLYSAISYYTFPPAVGLTQDEYNKLNKKRPDRRNDVPESLDDLQYQKVEVSTGKYNLGEGEELDLKEWTALGKAIKKVNAEFEIEGKIKIDESEIAEKLIDIYKKKSSEKGEDQEYLFESMYRYHLAHNGGKLESGFEISIEGLMQYKEFIGDRIKNDLIKDCLEKWRETHEKEFEELKNDTLNRLKNSQSQNFAKVSNMLGAIEKQKDESKKEKIIGNLDEFLKNFGMSYEMIKDRSIDEIKSDLETVVVEYEGELTEENYQSEEYYNSEAFLKSYDEFLAKHDSDQLVYQKIGSDLIAGINKKMRKEVDKFKFEDQSGQAEKRELEVVISKKKEHGVTGFNMGVCVTPDEKLWNDPEFFNCIMFDPKLKQAMGGMHFLIRENNLCLPGINPSLDVLGQVKNEELFDKMMEYAKKVKEKLGLEKILIPESSSIHSNRTQIQEIIRKKAFKKYNLKKEAEFSYSPFEYSFQECFEV